FSRFKLHFKFQIQPTFLHSSYLQSCFMGLNHSVSADIYHRPLDEVKMASHKQSFQCFDTIMDDPSLKPPFPHGHCSSASFRGSSGSTRLEPLEDRGCYLCADHQQAKAVASEASGAYSNPWYHFQTHPHSQQYTIRRPTRAEEAPGQVEGHHHHHWHSRKIVHVKNSDPSVRRTIVLHCRSLRSLVLFMDEVSELMQCLIRKLYTLEGHKVSLFWEYTLTFKSLRSVRFHLEINSIIQQGLNTKPRSSVCSDEKWAKKNGRSHSKNNRSAGLSISSEKLFPNGLNSLPPGHRGACPQTGENTMDDDIEKRVLVNKDGSLSMEMKVRFRLLHNETLHWSTEVKNAESCHAGEADETYSTKRYQRHFEEPHCQHCCTHCQEYDIWKNTVPPDQGSVRRIRSSSSSASSRRIVCKKASTDSMRTMTSEEYTEHVVEKATCIQQTFGQQGDTTIEQCTINHCHSRSEVRSMSPKTKSTSTVEDKRENTHVSENYEKRPDVISSNLPKDQLSVQITQPVEEEERPVSVVSSSSQILASLKEDQDDEDVDLPPSISRTSHGQQEDEESKVAEPNPCSTTPCKSPASPAYLSPRPPSTASSLGWSKRSRKLASPEVDDEEGRFEASASPKASSGPKNCKCVVTKDIATIGDSESNDQLEDIQPKTYVQDEEKEERALIPAPEPREEYTDHLNAAAERPQSCRSDTNVSEIKSEKSSKCRKRIGSDSSCHKMDDDMSELSPSCLPNASPTEVVNEWLRKIPSDTTLCDLGDEFHDNHVSIEPLCTSHVPSGVDNEHGSLQPSDVTKLETQNEMEGAHVVNTEGATDKKSPEVAEGDRSQRGDEPKMFSSSVLVMKVLLSPKLDRCNSLPEVSPVYGRKLSASVQGLLDCLANLQLLDFGPSDEDGKKEKYQEFMSMLKSLWLCDPKDNEKTSVERNKHLDEEFKARSSSGVDVNSGSTGSGKSSINDGIQAQINTECEGLDTLTKVLEVDETVEGEASETKYDSGTIEVKLKDDVPGSEETIRSNDSPRELIETPLSSNKSSGNNPKKEETESDRQEDTSSGSAPKQQKGQLSKRLSQDPDPVWVLNLLNKLEKQFMTHYINAMAEFKVRWNLDDNEQLDAMICELQDEVRRRIQSSIDRELRKIQGRAGRPRPPKDTMSRESTIQTVQRRRRLKVMCNQSIDPQPAKSDDDYTMTGTDFSDQRSDDEYCPCDTCLKKKMVSKHVLPVEMFNSAPVMKDFDLRRILQMKKSSPTNEKIEETRETTGEETSEDGQTAEAVSVGEDDIAGCDTAEEGETVEREKAEDGQTAEAKTSRDGEAAEDESAEAGETAEDKASEDGQISDEETTAENGHISEGETGEDGETGNGDTAEEHETAESETAEEGQTAEDETGEEGETVNDDTEEEHGMAENETVEERQTAEDETGEEGETINNDTTEEHETAESETTEDGKTDEDKTAEEGETAK
uniref:Rp1 like 1b n=1 Tax=Sinocyclocheilus rhinocerous TaxID=307959 RepID=A0A673MYS2_9TELE